MIQLTMSGVLDPGRVAFAGVAAAALHGAGTRRAVFSKADVAGQVAALLPTTGVSAAEVVEQVEQVEQVTDVAPAPSSTVLLRQDQRRRSLTST